ncbi:protein three rows [Drosophila subobscura]|uniref:protein three rows n=1 Tax=Drosophila subobscura TaxID=7241 RepID=UPI00155ABD8D|nr:protein three rows [Drosophila subobscura]
MSADIVNQLKGTRSDVKAAATTIEWKFREFSKGIGTNDAYPIRFELRVLRQLCLSLKDNQHQHADLYCDIVATMLPHMEPYEEKPNLWEAHLTSLRYIHHGLSQEKTEKECQKMYGLIRSQRCRLQEEGDFKFYLDIHLTHFNFIHLQMQKQTLPLAATDQLYYALESLGVLFDTMRQQKVAKNAALLVQLNESLFMKRSKGFLRSLSALPFEYTMKMYEPLLKLLSCSWGMPSSELSNQFSEHLGLVLALVHIDSFSTEAPLQQQLALQLLRICRDLYRNISPQSYAIQLLYYYVKLLYVREATPDFKRTYIDLCNKFVAFFEHKGATHGKEQWFMDLLVFFQRLQTLLLPSSSKEECPFVLFWQQLEGEGSPKAYSAHFQLLYGCLAVAVSVVRSPLGTSCTNEACKSIRRHCLLSFGMCALEAFNNWQQTTEQKADTSTHNALLNILVYTVDVAKSTKCLGPAAPEIIRLVRQLALVLEKVASPEQISLLQHLLEPLQSLRPLIAINDMHYLLRRIYKASAHCQSSDMASRLQSSYIAAQTNPSRLHSLLCVHYHNPKNSEKCVYEWHESSPLPSPLTPAEKNQLYDVDLLAVLHFLKAPPLSLLQSLFRYRRHDYHLVLLARKMRAESTMLRQCEQLRSKLQSTALKQPLTRMQELAMGHASVSVLLEALEAQKTKVSIKETAENSLEAFIVNNNLLELNIKREHRLVELATAAIAGFAAFFQRADQEPLDCDETPIDWEALIDDAVTAAMALSSMGYTAQADDAWLLLLNIGRMLDERFTYLRALTHFLAQDYLNPNQQLQLSEEVDRAQELLDDLWPQLKDGHFYKRHHTIVMLCLCHMASYHARQDCLCHAQLLLLQAEQLRAEFDERLGKCDIVLITVQTVRFRLEYQRKKRSSGLPRMPAPLRQLDTLADSVRNFYGLSSVDMGALQLLLADLVRESTECAANRLTERLGFTGLMLNMVLQSGMALRAIEVLISWLWMNLQMEYLDKAESKLRLLDHLLAIKPLSATLQEQPSTQGVLAITAKEDLKSNAISELTSNMLLMQLVEPIRKQNQLDIATPKFPAIRDSSPSSLQLQRYVSMHEAPPHLRDSMHLQSIYFIVGCLHARLSFLKRDNDQLDDFYVRAGSWLQEDSARTATLGSMRFVQELYHVNYLRYRKKHKEAIRHAEAGLMLKRQTADINYGFNFMSQLKTVRVEQRPVGKEKMKTLRRALAFNTSPDVRGMKALVETVAKAKASAKKTPRFKIYTELELRPPIGGSSSSSSKSGNENTPPSDHVDLNACQAIEISDEESAFVPASISAPLKRSQSVPVKATTQRTRSARARSQLKAVEIIELDDTISETTPPITAAATVKRYPTTDARSTRARNRQAEETPATTRGRPRGKVAAESAPQQETVSLRRRQRN